MKTTTTTHASILCQGWTIATRTVQCTWVIYESWVNMAFGISSQCGDYLCKVTYKSLQGLKCYKADTNYCYVTCGPMLWPKSLAEANDWCALHIVLIWWLFVPRTDGQIIRHLEQNNMTTSVCYFIIQNCLTFEVTCVIPMLNMLCKICPE